MSTDKDPVSTGSQSLVAKEVEAFIASIYDTYAVCFPLGKAKGEESYTFTLSLWPDDSNPPKKGQAVILSQIGTYGMGLRAQAVRPVEERRAQGAVSGRR